jgi:hypothetical protein
MDLMLDQRWAVQDQFAQHLKFRQVLQLLKVNAPAAGFAFGWGGTFAQEDKRVASCTLPAISHLTRTRGGKAGQQRLDVHGEAHN